jgi:hypothetical protein
MKDPKMEKYAVYVKLFVWGESPEDALDYANSALDGSDLLMQDGIVGIEVIDDVDSIELTEDDYDKDGEYSDY